MLRYAIHSFFFYDLHIIAIDLIPHLFLPLKGILLHATKSVEALCWIEFCKMLRVVNYILHILLDVFFLFLLFSSLKFSHHFSSFNLQLPFTLDLQVSVNVNGMRISLGHLYFAGQ